VVLTTVNLDSTQSDKLRYNRSNIGETTMYATQKNQIRNLTAQEFEALRMLCRLTKNLYNVGLYTVRQYFFTERKHLKYESNYHQCKTNENYQLLNTDIGQQTLKVVDRTFNSFFGLLALKNKGQYQAKVNLPHYLPKEGYFPLLIPGGIATRTDKKTGVKSRHPRIPIKDGKFRIPMSNEFRKTYGEVWLDFPRRIDINKLKEIRIHPKYDARFFEVELISEAEIEPQRVDPNKVLSIDLGVNNLATCISTDGASFIVDGKQIKSINHWYNKENARLQSEQDLRVIKGFTRKQATVAISRNNRVRDYLNKASRYIINFCIANQIGKIIIGYNPGIKQEVNMGGVNNQNFVQIPFWNFRGKLKSMSERYGLIYQETEESYTSKASFLDRDEIPVYNADNPQEYKFSGRRVKRGLYKTQDRRLINADLNGAANILVKSKHNLDFERVSIGFLAKPLRVRFA
jgi:putative transposase